jgi:hypothetical protein
MGHTAFNLCIALPRQHVHHVVCVGADQARDGGLAMALEGKPRRGTAIPVTVTFAAAAAAAAVTSTVTFTVAVTATVTAAVTSAAVAAALAAAVTSTAVTSTATSTNAFTGCDSILATSLPPAVVCCFSLFFILLREAPLQGYDAQHLPRGVSHASRGVAQLLQQRAQHRR